MSQEIINSTVKEIPAIMIAGGRPRDPAIMAAMISHSFIGIDKPLVAYIGAANNDNLIFFQAMKAILLNAGAKKVNFVHLKKKNPDLEAAKRMLTEADLIFLSGGEVENGMNLLNKCGLTEFLRGLYKNGKGFIGVSAGVIMMGSHWVHWDVEGDDTTSRLFECLGFSPLLFDVHGEDEDWVELKTALKLLGNGSKGYGLPSGSMVSVDSSGELVNLEKEYIVFSNKDGNINAE